MMTGRTATLVSVFYFGTALTVQGAATGGDAGAWRAWATTARAASLAQTFVAVADDPAALFSNVAGLDQIPGVAAAFTYNHPYATVDDVTAANAVVAYNLSGRGFALGTVGLGIEYFKVGGIPEAGALGLTGREFSDVDTAISLGWGKGLGGEVVAGEEPNYYLGLAARMVSTNLHDYQDTGFGLDAGLLFRPVTSLRLGVSFVNLVAPNVELKKMGDVYPAAARVGAALALTSAGRLTSEVGIRKDGATEGGLGGELTFAKTVAVRAGYRLPAGVPAAGVGVSAGHYLFDFGWQPRALLGDSFFVTLGGRW